MSIIVQHILGSQAVLAQMAGDKVLLAAWEEAAGLMMNCLQSGGKILIAGNGGSAADAQHLAGEIVGRFMIERKGYAAIALTTDTTVLTAVGNDYGFEQIFSRQVEALAKPGDVFLGISTSGNSPNVIKAVELAHFMGVQTIALLGRDGGKLGSIVDVPLVVKGSETAHIQEAHLAMYHAWCRYFDNVLESHE